MRSPKEALAAADEAMIVGGASIYRVFPMRAERMLLTLVDADIRGDTRFPARDAGDRRETAREHRAHDAANPYELDFLILERMISGR